MAYVNVALPGPWWHDLTYTAPCPIEPGCRVVVPMGRSQRVGVVTGAGAPSGDGNIKYRPVNGVLDESPVLSRSYLAAASLIARAYLASDSEVLKALLPSLFWNEKNVFAPYTVSERTGKGPSEFYYRYADCKRDEEYRRRINGASGGVLCLFSEREKACGFYKSLKDSVSAERLILWPDVGGKTALKAWNQALGTQSPVIVGGPGAACAPVADLSLVIIDCEASPTWRTHGKPHISLRSFAAARARADGALTLMSGRIPSSRVATVFSVEEERADPGGRLRVLDLYSSSRVSFRGLRREMPISDVLMTETLSRTAAKKTVLWILDRRGITNEIYCTRCEQTVLCPKCGSTVSYEGDRVRCSVCGFASQPPSVCPSCGGRVLQGNSPGLQALLPTIKNLVGDSPVYLWHADNPGTKTEARRRIADLKKEGGVVLGSRRALSLLDNLDIPLVCWLDADAATRQPIYSARFSAYSMLVESLWRGNADRTVLLQTRRPKSLPLLSLQAGWGYFWRREIKERSELMFPPENNLVEITLPESWSGEERENFAFRLDDAGYFTMQPDLSGRTLTVLAPQIAPLRKVLEEFFSIGRSRLGFPEIKVQTD